jgi:hypothetical protein
LALARGLLCVGRMNNRSLSLRDRLSSERLPLDLSLSLAVEVVDAVAAAHQRRQAFGSLTLADFVLQPDGSVAISAAVDPFADAASDSFAVGAVLYQLFTGFTPNQARAKLSVSPLHAAPPASLLNPALDDGLEVLLATLMAREPTLRPHSLRVVEGQLAAVCESLELEPSREALVAWAGRDVNAPGLSEPVEDRPARQTLVASVGPSSTSSDRPGQSKRRHVPTVELLDEEDEEDAPSPLRFDVWAAAACAFTVVAFAMATTL